MKISAVNIMKTNINNKSKTNNGNNYKLCDKCSCKL